MDLTKKMAFDAYFNNNMKQAPPQIHAWKANFDKAADQYVLMRKSVHDATPVVSLSSKESTSEKSSNTKAYAGATFGVIALIAAGSMVASLNKKVQGDNSESLL